jgi:hypothetical protein
MSHSDEPAVVDGPTDVLSIHSISREMECLLRKLLYATHSLPFRGQLYIFAKMPINIDGKYCGNRNPIIFLRDIIVAVFRLRKGDVPVFIPPPTLYK